MIIQPIIQSKNHATSYLWPRGCTDRQTDTHPRDENDYKKLGARRPAPGLKLIINQDSRGQRGSTLRQTYVSIVHKQTWLK